MSEAEIADLKDRMAAGSRWLKAEIKGREKAEADLAASRKELEVTHVRLRTAESARDEARAAGRESGDTNGSRAAGTTPDREGPTPSAAAKPAARLHTVVHEDGSVCDGDLGYDPDDERECAG